MRYLLVLGVLAACGPSWPEATVPPAARAEPAAPARADAGLACRTPAGFAPESDFDRMEVYCSQAHNRCCAGHGGYWQWNCDNAYYIEWFAAHCGR